MKKNFYFLVLLSLFFGIVSCKQDSDPEYPVTGVWSPVENVYTVVTNGQSQSTIQPYTACEQKSTLTITSDNKAHFSFYEVNPATANCEEMNTEDYTYVYDKNAKTISMKNAAGVTLYQILKLTDTEFQIKSIDNSLPTAPAYNTTLYRKL